MEYLLGRCENDVCSNAGGHHRAGRPLYDFGSDLYVSVIKIPAVTKLQVFFIDLAYCAGNPVASFADWTEILLP